ncbi:hypothetical protein H3309_10310 [Sandaracinobacteroides saxicola]|uniref:Uncharacterized protein n=2 Tax=Sandaracinobacteroides saxicola TaxID=2759707 RepID=A0A7G5IMN3_9SPHN|nr:hypothetical protein H3309_10310 [Sandaracinobacteroides saxicola]
MWQRGLTVGCTIEIDHSPENLGAHVRLDGEPAIGAGDRVRVLGGTIEVVPGEHRVLRRHAVIERATALNRLLTRVTGHFEMGELYDVSFTPGRLA